MFFHRYLTEGSRGSVKDRSGNGYPSVKLTGFAQCPLTLQVFIGTDTGRPKPHGFFQACRVTGRNVISCLERNIDGTQIMEIDLDPKNDMKVELVVVTPLYDALLYLSCCVYKFISSKVS